MNFAGPVLWCQTLVCRTGAVIALLGAAILGSPATAWTQDSAYCRKLRAHAAGDAALLLAPSVVVQGLKFPQNGMTDLVTAGNGYQLHAALSFSPLDMYKGSRLLRIGEADCQQHEAVVRAQELLLWGADFGRLPALRKQAAFLETKQESMAEIVAQSDQLLAVGATTLFDASEVRRRALDLSRKRVQVEGEIQRLQALGLDEGPDRERSSAVAEEVVTSAMRFEREVSHVRKLDPWGAAITGGINPAPLDYFGLVQLSINLGAFLRYPRESSYLAARAEELKSARYEVPAQLRRFMAQAVSARAQAQQEQALVDQALTSLRKTRDTLAEHPTAPSAAHGLALLDLELIATGAESVYLTALTAALSQGQEDVHGH